MQTAITRVRLPVTASDHLITREFRPPDEPPEGRLVVIGRRDRTWFNLELAGQRGVPLEAPHPMAGRIAQLLDDRAPEAHPRRQTLFCAAA